MRVELTEKSLDFVFTKEGLMSFGVAASALALIVMIGGWTTAGVIVAGTAIFAGGFQSTRVVRARRSVGPRGAPGIPAPYPKAS